MPKSCEIYIRKQPQVYQLKAHKAIKQTKKN